MTKTMALALLALAATAKAGEAQQTIDTTLAVEPGGRLFLRNPIGGIVVRGGDRPEIQLRATMPAADRINYDRTGSMLEIGRVVTGPMANGQPAALEVTIPRGLHLEVLTRTGTVDVSAVSGSVRIRSANGDVKVSGTGGTVTIETSAGAVSVSNATGSVAVNTSAGTITLTGAASDATLESSSGNISVTNSSAARIKAVTLRGDVTFSGALMEGGDYTLQTHSGMVGIRLPSAANATIRAQSIQGAVDNQSGTAARKREGVKEIVVGRGGAMVQAISFRGLIRVRRGSP